MAAITEQQLENASADAQALESIVNDGPYRPNPGHPDGTVTTRLGRTVETISKVIADQIVQEQIASSQATIAQQAAAVAQQIIAGLDKGGGAAFLKDRIGFAIDARTSKTESAVKVIGGGKDFEGSLRAWLPTAFNNPQQVVDRNGATVWSPHNAIYGSDDPRGPDWSTTRATVAARNTMIGTMFAVSATDTDGRLSSSDVLIDNVVAQAMALLVKADTSSTFAIAKAAGGDAVWFDLASATATSATGALSGEVFRTNPDGSALPDGYYLCVVKGLVGAYHLVIYPGAPSGSFVTAAGRSVLISKPRAHYGNVALSYIARAAYVPGLPVACAIPYDWSRFNADGSRRQSVPIIQTSGFTINPALIPDFSSLYISGEFENVAGDDGGFALFEAQNSAASSIAFFNANTPASRPYINAARNTGDARNATMGDLSLISTTKFLAMTMVLRNGPTSLGCNGDIADVWPDGTFVGQRLLVAGNNRCRFYLDAIVGLSEALSFEDQSAWNDGADHHPTLTSSSVIRHMSQNAGVDRSREPVVRNIGETASGTEVLALALERSTAGTTFAEVPARVVFTLFHLSKAGKFSRVRDGILAQPTGWAAGTGHAQSAVIHKIKAGPRRGEIVSWVSLNQSDPYTGDATVRSLYRYRSVDNLKNISAGVRVVQPTDVIAGATFIIPDPTGVVVEFPQDGPYPGRLAFVAMVNFNDVRVFWTDDYGDTLQWGAAIPGLANLANEPTLELLPDGRLLILIRVEEGPNKRCAAISDDGGATAGNAFPVPAYQGGAVAAGAIQLDPQGATGRFGRPALLHSNGNVLGRSGVRLDVYEDASLVPVKSVQIISDLRAAGYQGGDTAQNSKYLPIGVETWSQGGFNDRCGTFIKNVDCNKAGL